MAEQRIVELSRGAFVELKTAVLPTENWVDADVHRPNCILYTGYAQPELRKHMTELVFVPKPPKPPAAGILEVGTTGKGEIVVNHPDIDPDKDGVGHLVFSPAQARNLARLLREKADEASREKHG